LYSTVSNGGNEMVVTGVWASMNLMRELPWKGLLFFYVKTRKIHTIKVRVCFVNTTDSSILSLRLRGK
jgi:hypothetical protein